MLSRKNQNIQLSTKAKTVISAPLESPTIAPKKVVKALHDFVGESEAELTFQKGEFFYVLDEDDPDWYFLIITL